MIRPVELDELGNDAHFLKSFKHELSLNQRHAFISIPVHDQSGRVILSHVSDGRELSILFFSQPERRL